MIRVVIENILLFLLPTLIYVGFMLVRKRDQPSVGAKQIFDDAPIIWLLVSGAIMMIAGLAYFGSYTGGKPGEQYQPPSYRDGKIVPGQRK
ncbi:MAG: DUF6111 family protein [Hyphomicrobiaceae bacterium]